MLPQLLDPAIPLAATLLAVLALAVWFDIGERRIPNAITAGGLVIALALRGMQGPEYLMAGLAGTALGLFLGLLLFAAGAMGAGDGKLLTAVGALLGLDTYLRCIPLVGVCGGLLGLAAAFRKGTVISTLSRMRDLLLHALSLGRVGERRVLSTPGAVTVPYGVAIAAGAVMAWLGWGMTP